MAEQLSNLIDLSGLSSDVQTAVKELDKVEQKIEEVNKTVLTIKAETKGVETVGQLNDFAQRANASVTELRGAVDQAAAATTSLNTVTLKYGEAAREEVVRLVELSQELRSVDAELKRVNNTTYSSNEAYIRAQNNILKLTERQIQLKAAIATTNKELKTVAPEAEVAAGGMRIFGLSIDQAVTRLGSMAFRLTVMQLLFTPIVNGISNLIDYLTKLSDEAQNAADRLKNAFDSFAKFQNQKKDTEIEIQVKATIKKADFETFTDQMKRHLAEEDPEKAFNDYQKLQEIAPKILDQVSKEDFLRKGLTATMQIQIDRANDYIDTLVKLGEAEKNRESALKEQATNRQQQRDLKADILKYAKSGRGLDDFGARNIQGKSDDEILQYMQSIITGKDKDASAYLHTDIGRKVMQLNQLQANQIRNDNDVNDFFKQVSDLQKTVSETEGNSKNKKPAKQHPERDAKREMEAELKIVDETRKIKNDIALKEYAQSKQTIADQLKLLTDRNNNEQAAKEKELTILQNYSGKIGETQEQELARRTQYLAKGAAADAQFFEARRKIQDELAAEYAKGDQANKEYIASLEAFDQRLGELGQELESKKAYFAAIRATRGIGSDEKRQQARENIGTGFDLAAGENRVRLDNIAQQKAGDRLATANVKVQQQEVTPDGQLIPIEKRNTAEYEKALKERQDAYEAYSAAVIKTTTDTNAQTEALAKAKQDKEDQEDEKRKQKIQEAADLSVRVATETASAITTINANRYQHEQDLLDKQERSVQLAAQQRIQAINASTGYSIQKANQLADVNSQAAAQENAIETKKKQLAIEKARFERSSAEASIILNTAAAIVKAMVSPGWPEAIPIMAAEAAVGAAQFAAASSAPIPTFAQGGRFEGNATGTIIAGERGPELGITPSGQSVIFDKPGIYLGVPAGTEIKTAEETERLINHMISSYGLNGQSLAALQQFQHQVISTKKIEEGLENLLDAQMEIARATLSKPQPRYDRQIEQQILRAQHSKGGRAAA